MFSGNCRQVNCAIVRTRKGACIVISRSFPRWVDIDAWPVQQRFAYRAKFQKLFNDRGEISNLGYLTSFPHNQRQQSGRSPVH